MRRARHGAALTLGTALALGAAFAGCTAPEVAQQRAAIVGGSEDTRDPAVVAILDRRASCPQPDVPARLICSGTLIAPRVVLTAAHCLKGKNAAGALEVYVGSPLDQDPAGRYLVVSDAVVHPAWDDTTHDYDLALLRLAEPAPITPAALPQSTLGAQDVGASARVVGYGATAVAQVPDGIRRQGLMVVSAVTATQLETTPSPANSCGGDSGGPVFVTLPTGEELLAVTSSGDPTCQVYATNARVDVAIADFIQPYLDATAAAPPGWSPTATVALDQLCTQTCTTAADCPAALACVSSVPGTPPVCELQTAQPGDLGGACASDGDCGAGELCQRLWPDGDDACRCNKPCAGAPPPPGGDGCAVDASGRAGAGATLLVLALLLALTARAAGRS